MLSESRDCTRSRCLLLFTFANSGWNSSTVEHESRATFTLLNFGVPGLRSLTIADAQSFEPVTPMECACAHGESPSFFLSARIVRRILLLSCQFVDKTRNESKDRNRATVFVVPAIGGHGGSCSLFDLREETSVEPKRTAEHTIDSDPPAHCKG